jgi:DNA-binding Xre family transcriptional regulator
MVESSRGGAIVRSRLKQLITEREQKLGRRIHQKEIVEATGLNPNTISRWMSPTPFQRFESEPLLRLCEYLNCEIGDLVFIDRAPTAENPN